MILLEAFSPVYRSVTEFLIAIAEPKKRPALLHEYELTPNSLYASVSLNYSTQKIKHVLRSIAKNRFIPPEVDEYITEHTAYYGQAKCVLHNNKYFIECLSVEALHKLSSLGIIQKYLGKDKNELLQPELIEDAEKKSQEMEKFDTVKLKPLAQVRSYLEQILSFEESNEKKSRSTQRVYRFEIDPREVATDSQVS